MLTSPSCFSIPGVINRGALGKPMLIEVDPLAITFLMKNGNTRFLGRRYILVRFASNLMKLSLIVKVRAWLLTIFRFVL